MEFGSHIFPWPLLLPIADLALAAKSHMTHEHISHISKIQIMAPIHQSQLASSSRRHFLYTVIMRSFQSKLVRMRVGRD
jgi:hypothetical protein